MTGRSSSLLTLLFPLGENHRTYSVSVSGHPCFAVRLLTCTQVLPGSCTATGPGTQGIYHRPGDLDSESRIADAMVGGLHHILTEERYLGQHTSLAVPSLSSDAEQSAVSSSGLFCLPVLMRVSTPAFVLEDGMTPSCS